MIQRTKEDFDKYNRLYSDGDFFSLTSSEEGLFFLLLRSLARTDNYRYLAEKVGISIDGVPVRSLPLILYTSNVTATVIEGSINDLYAVERDQRKVEEQTLFAQLVKLRVFDWGGVHQNDINRYLIDNYVKKIVDYDELVDKVESEILWSVKNFMLCSWYNHWTSIIIEDIFNDHPRVLPAIGKIKQVDFFVENRPFDLKVTYFPAGFLEDERQRSGLVRSELAELKGMCREFAIPIDRSRRPNDLMVDIITAMSESSDATVKDYYAAFVQRRKNIIDHTVKNPRTLIKWLYENQGTQRFDASNRLFLILINQNSMEESWKLKRDYNLLETKITSYLNAFSAKQEDRLLEWSAGGITYKSYADAIFILK